MEEFKIPDIDLKSYSYTLPPERIAERPAESRSESKLLAASVACERIKITGFASITDFIPDGSLMIMNSSRVIPARIPVRKPGGGRAEILCTDPLLPSFDPQEVYKTKGATVWKAVIGGKRIKAGAEFVCELTSGGKPFTLNALIIEKEGATASVRFTCSDPDISFGEAAPTAGLHFTDDILEKLKSKGVEFCKPVLHVGPGTFKPIDTEKIADFKMHGERIFLSSDNLKLIAKYLEGDSANKIVAVGTTSVRTVESAYRLGVMLCDGRSPFAEKGVFSLPTAEAYRVRSSAPSALEAVNALTDYMKTENLDEINGVTSLLIVPGYEYKIVKALITNFHIPESTLILLVSAFAGEGLRRKIYDTALENRLRFLSYGDSSIILGKDFPFDEGVFDRL